MSAKHLLTAIQQVMSSPLLQDEEDPSNRKDLYFLFRWLFQELLINLNLLRNNEVIKFLNYQILKKNPGLLAFIKNKIKAQAQMKMTPQAIIEADNDDQGDYMKSIDKAISVLQTYP